MSTEPLESFGGSENLRRKRLYGRIFVGICILSALVGILALIVLIADLVYEAWGWMTLDFLTYPPSRFPGELPPGRSGSRDLPRAGRIDLPHRPDRGLHRVPRRRGRDLSRGVRRLKPD